MEFILDGLKKAFFLLISFDQAVISAVFISLKVSLTSVCLAALFAVPVGFFIGSKDFFGKRSVVIILQTSLSIPTVLIGLLVFSFISHRGPLGEFELLYTPSAMVLGQFFLASPIITAFVFSVVEGADKRIMKTALSLGATYFQAALTLISEVRCGIMAALIAGFGRVFGEIGVSMMLGGNIKNYTRNITTTIALETAKGEFALGIALGIILLVVAFVLSIGVYLLREKVA